MNRHRQQRYLPGTNPWPSGIKGCAVVVAGLSMVLAFTSHNIQHVDLPSTTAAAPGNQSGVITSQTPFDGSPYVWAPRRLAGVHDVARVEPLPRAARPVTRQADHVKSHPDRSIRDRIDVEHMHHHTNDAPEVHRSSEQPSRRHLREHSERHESARHEGHHSEHGHGDHGSHHDHSSGHHDHGDHGGHEGHGDHGGGHGGHSGGHGGHH